MLRLGLLGQGHKFILPSSGHHLWWLWLLVALVLIAVASALYLIRRRRGARTSRG